MNENITELTYLKELQQMKSKNELLENKLKEIDEMMVNNRFIQIMKDKILAEKNNMQEKICLDFQEKSNELIKSENELQNLKKELDEMKESKENELKLLK